MTDIGAMLREARMREHLDIAEFEARTKIRAKYLRALEDEEWALLPGYTFTKAFLRTYADMLGLDGRMLVDEFKRQYPDPSELELAPVLPARRDARRDARRGRDRHGERQGRQAGPSGRVLLAALLVVLVAAAVFVVHELRKKTTPAGTTTTTTTTTTHHSTHKKKAKSASTTPTTVGVSVAASTPVAVCLIGYVTAHGGVHQRVPPKGSATATQTLEPGARAPVYHDNHFVVSFTDGAATMKIDGRAKSVAATGTTLSYEVGRSGAHLLPAGDAPHCT
jgi:cytoskeleton protein RodZ